MTQSQGKARLATEAAAVLGGYALLAIAICWPIPAELGRSVLGSPSGDALAGVWWYDALQATGYHLFGTTTFERVGLPFGLEQANSLNLQWLWPNYPAYLLTKAIGEVATYNVVVLTGFAFSGAAMYLLARRLGCAPLVAAWAGLVFVVFPWHTERAIAGHPTLVHLECLPLLLVAVHAYLRHETWRRLGLVALAALFCWFTSGLYGLMAIVVVAGVATAVLVVDRRRARRLRAGLLLVVAPFVASGAVYALSLAGGRDGGLGSTRSADDLSIFGLRPLELVVPAPRSLGLQDLVEPFYARSSHGSNPQEISNYLGLLTLVLALMGLIAVVRRRIGDATVRLVAAGGLISGAVALVLAAPSPISVGGRLVTATPSRLLFDVLPAFRVPARWSVVIMLAATTLAALGLQVVWQRALVTTRDRFVVAACIVIVPALAISLLELTALPGAFRVDAESPPPAYALLDDAPAGALVEYPLLPTGYSRTSGTLFWQRAHERLLLNGAAPLTRGDDVRRTLVDPSEPGTASRLAALGVTTVITNPGVLNDVIEDDERAPADVPLTPATGYRLLGRTADGASVWAVAAPPARAIATLRSPAFGDIRLVGRRVVQPLLARSGSIDVSADEPGRVFLTLTLFARGEGSRRVGVGGRAVPVSARGTTVCVPVRLVSGTTRLLVDAGAAPSSAEGDVLVTAPIVADRCRPAGTASTLSPGRP